ncbi:MAG: hypothetical protein FWE38_04370 [Firmicutes bacterium]|nr:hypothetical protein [Bacillota bacterium]
MAVKRVLIVSLIVILVVTGTMVLLMSDIGFGNLSAGRPAGHFYIVYENGLQGTAARSTEQRVRMFRNRNTDVVETRANDVRFLGADTFARSGFHFTTWLDADGNPFAANGYIPAGWTSADNNRMVLTPNWVAGQQQITFNTGTNQVANPAARSVEFGGSVGALPTVTSTIVIDGQTHTWLGWRFQQGGAWVDAYDNMTVTWSGNIVFHGNWHPPIIQPPIENFAMTLNFATGTTAARPTIPTSVAQRTITATTGSRTMPTVTRVGHNAPTWRMSAPAAAGNRVIANITAAFTLAEANNWPTVTLTANWTERTIEVTYRVVEGRRITGPGTVAGRTSHVITMNWFATAAPMFTTAGDSVFGATGRTGYVFHRWWTQENPNRTRVPIENMTNLRNYILNNNITSGRVSLVVGWQVHYIYNIRFFFNDGTDRFLTRSFNQADLHTPLTPAQLYYVRSGNRWIHNNAIFSRNNHTRLWWATHRFATTTNPNATIDPRNRLDPDAGRTINQLLLDPFFYSYRVRNAAGQNTNEFRIYVFAVWLRH